MIILCEITKKKTWMSTQIIICIVCVLGYSLFLGNYFFEACCEEIKDLTTIYNNYQWVS